jgi:membrane protein
VWRSPRRVLAVKPRHDVLHRQRKTNCSFERAGAHRDEERELDRQVAAELPDEDEEVRPWAASRPRAGVTRERGRGPTDEPVRSRAKEPIRELAKDSVSGPERESARETSAKADGSEDPHGRTARDPTEIPASGWRDITVRVWRNLRRHNASLVAAGIGLHGLLAVFPGLAVIMSVYGMFASPQDVMNDLRQFLGVLPPDAAKVLLSQLQSLAGPANRTLGFGAGLSAIVALWSARQGMAALMRATNIAYNQREGRGFLQQSILAIAFTVVAMFIFAVMLGVGVAVPLLLQVFPLRTGAAIAVLVARWLLLWLFAVLALSLVYRYAPDRQPPKWRWVTWGSALAATVWLLISFGFAAYVQNFGSFGKAYGALGGVIVLLMWFYLTGFTIVLGGEINAEMEHQTGMDTTEGPPAPMGRRGAYVADTVGRLTP